MEALSENQSSLGIKHIPNRGNLFKNPYQWLEEKKVFDGAEGLWRVHDNLYDVEDFIKSHPGGQFWLEVTKGMDITEAFESHHISTKPEEVLKKYFVRQAKTPRNSPFTFHDNGFYRTLKRNVREILKTIPKGGDKTATVTTDILLSGVFIFAVFANVFWSYSLGIISGVLLSSTGIAAHNYYHQKDNFRMYYSDLAMIPAREWRIIHVLSHHLYTNTARDMQAYFIEPIMDFYPHSKSILIKYGAWIYGPFFIWPTMYFLLFFISVFQWVFLGYHKNISKVTLLAAVLPLTMYVFSGQSLFPTIGMWSFIIAVHSFWSNFVGAATTHFHPDIFIDGDKPRPESESDWGISQLDTVGDRYEITGNQFLVLVTFGDHALHHLFPTFDHGLLHHLYPVVEKTMKEFNLNIRMTTHTDMLQGYFKRLAKDKPNPNPPNLLK